MNRASLGQRSSLLLGKEDVGSTQHKVSWGTAGALRRAYAWTSIEIFTNVDNLPSLSFDLFHSLLGKRSENVASSFAKRGQVHAKEHEPPQIPSLAQWAFRG